MNIRAICFDFDGTLAAFTGDFSAYIKSCFERLDIKPTPEFLQVFNQHLRAEGHLTSLIAFERTCAELGLMMPQKASAVYQDNIEAYAAQVGLLPNAKAMLEYFSRLPKAIITNGPADMQWAAIRKVGIADMFKTIIVSGDADVAIRKPRAEIFHMACERLGVLPAETLMIGDHLEADIQGAVNAGLKALHIS